ncbi:MAG: 3-dehydroquinate synthase [Candidatus Sedimenticola endophacoides]|uniref:3-dehydroquinate synthase n=1 Tax=Candidatus Sedimenticola endophacoides TaxID=2548426 RepID=A0A657PPP2_9GAMM|nr:MAG: 3-dehydroquinate synthase [Candidatus Sedimenticola endophacoides]OQX36073.1 MAG: 3-dehydroquinate synthase [Candidatus Sedimenticola endophacoides]OQX36303.1 MAG: 3-dehydroquinate synthase [Candidatus Sedimenticola endophacoides]OQX41088.1 MAG: 3-dehydroquinate synthase [Candidatus Sedimenticola endophacoides]OQX42873.1 MAG: 3-dehydroquinate synthase [Candidatus Sedimenticola endophacoides]
MNAVTKTLTVDLGERSYPIYIGPGLLGDPRIYREHIPGRQVMVVTNETVAPLYLERVCAALGGYQLARVILPDGERYKSLEIWQRIITALLEARFDRQCTVLALGGGVVGDMAGFAAASYQRGVNFVQVPTTLLSQVDSSVGGKTGVNHPLGKNMIGAFYQPRCVIADTASLDTLDDRQLSAGLAEVIKYGLIDDLPFFEWLERNMEPLLAREADALSHAIERSCLDKARVVAADELESGRRALLNLGHTFGHAIETGMGYGEWLHGEAVAVGMCMAADLSRRLGWFDMDAQARVVDLVARARLPVAPPPDLDGARLLELMAVDKKVQQGRMRLVLMQGMGHSLVTDQFDSGLLRATLSGYGRNDVC